MGKLEQQYSALEQQASAPEFWDSQDTAQATLQQMSSLKSSMDSVKGLQALLADAEAAMELAELAVRPLHRYYQAAHRDILPDPLMCFRAAESFSEGLVWYQSDIPCRRARSSRTSFERGWQLQSGCRSR